jgi:hypothetical protein
VVSPKTEVGRDGPGDSGLVMALSMICERLFAELESFAPHISQLLRDGWFENVQRGHWFRDTSIGACVVCGEDESGLFVAGAGVGG